MRYGLVLMALTLLITVASAGDVEVKIEGPKEASGGFAVVGSGTEGAVLRWRIDGPEDAPPPLDLVDAQGRPVLVFINPAHGLYRITLVGQLPKDGLDPWGEAVHPVQVGKSPGPNPGPGPEPEPDPDTPLPPEDPLARKVYNAALAVQSANKATEAKMFADIFEAVAGQAAGVSTIGVAEMVQMTSRKMQSDIPPDVRLKWDSWKNSFSSIMSGAGLTTKEQHIEAWSNIADALRRIK